MVQAAYPATALLTRLRTVFDESFEHQITTAAHHPTGSHFRDGMTEVFTLMVHETDGWSSRNKAQSWLNSYTQSPGSGLGPQTAIAGDGTVTQVMGYPRVTWHGEFLNGRSLGTETGHGADARDEAGVAAKPAQPATATTPAKPAVAAEAPPDIAPDTTAPNGTVRSHWQPFIGPTGASQVEDVPGGKLFCMEHHFDAPDEVLITWWSSSLYTTRTHADFLYPARKPPGGQQNYPTHILPLPPHPTMMLFSEAQYRSWSLLARYLCETFLIPRNLPLFPWINRADNTHSPAGSGSPKLRLIVKADPNFTTIRDDLTANVAGFNATIFDDANLAAYRTAYDNSNVAARTIVESAFNLNNNNKAVNKAWLYLFKSFRGIVGHGFAGSVAFDQHGNPNDDHDCPGPLFDWYRFARELYDWWWYPFDFDAAFATTATPKRAILTPRAESTDPADPGDETPLIEHFWENTPTDGRADPYLARALRPPSGLLGQTASPDTFRLEANSPIYAMANGELVAARILQPSAGVNMSFVLIRHEVFHVTDPSGMQAIIARLTGDPVQATSAAIGRIDYTVEPTTVFSLYMHLGGGDQVNFDTPVAANPTWLNRVLVRKMECDLAISSTGTLNAALQAMPAAAFTTPPPAAAGRPDPLTLLRLDKDRLTTFMNHLRAGDVAPAPARAAADNFGPTPIKILLGDMLGVAGTTRVTSGTASLGVLVEVFAPSLIGGSPFNEVANQNCWVPGTTTNPAIRYASEWGRPLTAQENAAVKAAGADATLMNWWSTAIANLAVQVGLTNDQRLPLDATVYHYAPLDFIRWINSLTWISEWSKYKATDGGTEAPLPVKPPARRL